MRQQQIQKTSGQHFDVNLDSISFAALCACQQVHRSHQNNFSNSVIVRRALRHYLGSLEGMPDSAMSHELVETKRAAKGVL